MPYLYAATSKNLQNWGGDVGLGKNLYILGLCPDENPDAVLAGRAGRDDWTIIKKQEVQADMDISGAIRRLSAKEKWVDPSYYPALQGLDCLFRIDPVHVENALLLDAAMANTPLPRSEGKTAKVKPTAIATYMLRLAIGS